MLTRSTKPHHKATSDAISRFMEYVDRLFLIKRADMAMADWRLSPERAAITEAIGQYADALTRGLPIAPAKRQAVSQQVKNVFVPYSPSDLQSQLDEFARSVKAERLRA